MIKQVHLTKSGLEMFFGSIETQILRAIWRGNNTSGTIYRYMVTQGSTLAYTTVFTVLNRMVELDKLQKSADDFNTTIYTSQWSNENDCIKNVLADVFISLYSEFPDDMRDQMQFMLAVAER